MVLPRCLEGQALVLGQITSDNVTNVTSVVLQLGAIVLPPADAASANYLVASTVKGVEYLVWLT